MAFQYNPKTDAYRCACGGTLLRDHAKDQFDMDEMQFGYACGTCKGISHLPWKAKIETQQEMP